MNRLIRTLLVFALIAPAAFAEGERCYRNWDCGPFELCRNWAGESGICKRADQCGRASHDEDGCDKLIADGMRCGWDPSRALCRPRVGSKLE